MHLRSVSLRRSGGSVRLIGEVESERRHGPLSSISSSQPRTQISSPKWPIRLSRRCSFLRCSRTNPSLFRRLSQRGSHSNSLVFATSSTRRHPATLKRSDIHVASVAAEPKLPANHAATFFSGGVDSFYTLLKHRREHLLPAPLTHVIFMRGIEKPLDFARGVEASEDAAEAIATTAGVRCISGKAISAHSSTRLAPPLCGSALAATALSLAAGLDYVCIPSTYWYADFVPIGSTPLTDERFSNDRVRSRARRRRIAANGEDCEDCRSGYPELVLTHLRVCALNFGGPYNCGKCWKCVRTAIPLAYLGVFNRATTFPDKSTTHWESVLEMDSLPFVEENLRFARTHNTKPELTALLGRIVQRRTFRTSLRAAVENSYLRPGAPGTACSSTTTASSGSARSAPQARAPKRLTRFGGFRPTARFSSLLATSTAPARIRTSRARCRCPISMSSATAMKAATADFCWR